MAIISFMARLKQIQRLQTRVIFKVIIGEGVYGANGKGRTIIVRIGLKSLLKLGLTTKIRPSKLRCKYLDPTLDLDSLDFD